MRNKKKGKFFQLIGLLMLLPVALTFPARAQGTVIGTSNRTLAVPDAGTIPHITVGGEEAYSMFINAAPPENTAFRREEPYEDAGAEAILYAGYPLDGLGLQKKYGVSDDFARVVTQQALWFYIAGLPFESTEDSVRARYMRELLQAAEDQIPQEHPVSISPENPSFQHQGGYYRSETVTLTRAEGSIAVQPENGVQILSEDGTAVTTLRQGDRFILLAPDYLTEITLNVTHQFSVFLPVHYIPETDNPKMDHLLRMETQEQTRSGIWRFSLPEQPSAETQPPSEEPSVSLPSGTTQAPSSTPADTTAIDSPSTGGTGTSVTAATLLGLCWVTTGLIFLGKRNRNGTR